MSETISLNLAVEVASGPTMRESRTLELDAYDKVTLTVPDGSKDLKVELQPGGSGSARLLVIHSSHYGIDLTYTVDGGNEKHALDEPHVLFGAGAVGLLGSGPTKLSFSSKLGSGNDAEVQILVGRDATP